MAKARMTNKRNVKVTMTQDQFLIINELLERVRLGTGFGKKAVSNYLDTTDLFVQENFIEGNDFTYAVSINEKTEQYSDFTIELGDADE